ncbi:MAG TPA: type II toxin-antitoxin system prevent-host-death family antitoxin [Xanthobacteraceae bacterium]|nr:type II toxin-antitoxin system prevent-host-death family antitoxin [Xanthobacteraceae bacterium]
MEKAISAADANRRFSLLLREVREGQRYVVTSHGRPVARIVPVGGADAVEESVAAHAHAVLLARLAGQTVTDIGRWSRDELYEDDV